ncbi:hypothetical protein K0M31_001497 [Melipona bicolor]|uniref:Uncharacterized protein n=1 Tax=Melipona bicolor TaxID=60889 RepID=A0AA40KXP0_9HYME|nr:hypothetical protein K0M31_001497 [Melipona bicolor]
MEARVSSCQGVWLVERIAEDAKEEILWKENTSRLLSETVWYFLTDPTLGEKQLGFLPTFLRYRFHAFGLQSFMSKVKNLSPLPNIATSRTLYRAR